MAQDVTIEGEIETRWLHDFNLGGISTDDGVTVLDSFQENPVIEVKVNVAWDDNTELYVELEEGDYNVGIFDKAHFTLDIGGLYMLPVGITVRTGIDEYDLFDESKVTLGEWEDVIGTDWVLFGHQVDIAVNEMVAIRALWANDFGVKGYSIGAAVTYDPVYVEVGYVEIGALEDGEEIGKGDIEVGSEFAMDVADGINVAAAVNLDYDLEDSGSLDPEWTLGAAGALSYMEMATLGVAFVGMTDSEANSMQVDVEVSPIEDVSVILIAGLGLDDDVYPETFDSFEGSLKLGIGPSTWWLGILYVADGGWAIAKEQSEIDPATDSMSLWMRTEIKY
jgi:hypothetical protein